jgi:hypothetical protein
MRLRARRKMRMGIISFRVGLITGTLVLDVETGIILHVYSFYPREWPIS